MKKRIFVIIMCIVIVLVFWGCTPQNSKIGNKGNKKVTLKLFSAWPENNSMLIDMQKFIDKVTEKTNGSVIIKWGGGPEAIPASQLVEALKNNIVDIAWTCHTYNVSHVPVMEGMKLTDAATLRSNGGFKFVNDIYIKELGAHYLGNFTDGLTYNIYSNKPIKILDDFKGMTIRATPAYEAFVKALGAGSINMSASDAYQALERNVIQGYGWPSIGIKDYGWQEVSKYIIEPAFYNVDGAVFVSKKAWDRLSKEQREALQDSGREVEEEAKIFYEKAISNDRAELLKNGMKICKLDYPTDKAYLKLAYTEAWKHVLEMDSKNGAKLQNFTNFKK